jgi:hypothetical protein
MGAFERALNRALRTKGPIQMPEKITNEERLQLVALGARADAASARLEAAQMAFNQAAERIAVAHNLTPGVDNINIETGEIQRKAPPTEPAPPA